MRTALVTPIGLGLALALAPDRASADPPHVAVRLSYVRGSGGEACPAEPTALRAEVKARMGYDPFERANAPDRLAVVMVAKGRGFAALVERFNAAGANTWSEMFFPGAFQGDCAALMTPLASYLRALFLILPGRPAAPPAAPPPEPAVPLPKLAAPAPSPAAASARELRAPAAQPAKSPEPLSAPNSTRATARNVAFVAYAAAGAFLGWGFAWWRYAQSKENTAQALSTQSHRAGGDQVCTSSDAPDSYCRTLLGAWQSRDAALNHPRWLVCRGWHIIRGRRCHDRLGLEPATDDQRAIANADKSQARRDGTLRYFLGGLVMNRKHARITGGLFVAVLAASTAALGFSGCHNAAGDCHNTRTCEPPPCNMDAGNDGSPLGGWCQTHRTPEINRQDAKVTKKSSEIFLLFLAFLVSWRLILSFDTRHLDGVDDVCCLQEDGGHVYAD